MFVVTVGSDGTGIETNMTLDRMDAAITKDEQRILDAEHDILFYLGDKGASYSFKPESGCTVTVARSTVSGEMTFSGFTNSGVTVAEDGSSQFVYTPYENKTGKDSFTYVAVDPAGNVSPEPTRLLSISYAVFCFKKTAAVL